MKTFKKTLIGLAVLLVLLIAAIFLVPQQVQVKESRTMKVKPSTLFNIVNNMKLDNTWNPWDSKDTSMVTTYGDITSGLGASSSWTSNEMGDGTLKFVTVEKDTKIISEITFGGMGGGILTYDFAPTDEGTLMTWSMDTKTSRPWNLMNFLIKRDVKKSYTEGLQSIEKLALAREKGGEYIGYQIKEELVQGKTYVTNRGEVTFDKIGQFYAQNLGPLFQKIQKANVEMDGHPSGLFYSYDMTKGVTDMAAGIPISQDVNIMDATSETFDTRKAIVVDYMGDYSNTTSAHEAIDQYMTDRGIHFDWPVIEEYVTDPSEEPNPEKWLTRIVYNISE